MTPLWRKAYDAIERPLAAGSEAWIQSDTFMDLATHSIRVQRRLLREVQQNTERWLHLWGWVSRGDVIRLSNQVASLERQVRELRQEADQRRRPLLDGRAGGSRGRSGGSRGRPGGSPGRSGWARPASAATAGSASMPRPSGPPRNIRRTPSEARPKTRTGDSNGRGSR